MGQLWNSLVIDHIIALWKFDLTDPTHFSKAIHFTNLQPLTISDHKKKTSKDISEAIKISSRKRKRDNLGKFI